MLRETPLAPQAWEDGVRWEASGRMWSATMATTKCCHSLTVLPVFSRDPDFAMVSLSLESAAVETPGPAHMSFISWPSFRSLWSEPVCFPSYSGPHFTEPHAGVDHLVLFASPDFSRVDTPKSAHVFISRGPGLLLVCRLKERFTPWFAQRQAYCGWPLESELSVSEEELEMK